MAGRKHQCAAASCGKQVDLELLMCRRHWFMVPPDLRAKVWQGYRRGMDEAYDQAVTAAVEAVARREKASQSAELAGG